MSKSERMSQFVRDHKWICGVMKDEGATFDLCISDQRTPKP